MFFASCIFSLQYLAADVVWTFKLTVFLAFNQRSLKVAFRLVNENDLFIFFLNESTIKFTNEDGLHTTISNKTTLNSLSVCPVREKSRQSQGSTTPARPSVDLGTD